MEHTLRALCKCSYDKETRSLNPCFSGTYSQSAHSVTITHLDGVLILVLVEHTLRGTYDDAGELVDEVLILVLVEHTLRGHAEATYEAQTLS